MAKKNRSKKQIDLNEGDFSDNPFAALSGLSLPDADPKDLLPPPTKETPVLTPVKLRMEKKGRRGKTVTCISGTLEWPSEERERIIRLIKKDRGTGASFDGEDIIVQGDHRKALKVFFQKQQIGAK